LRKAAINPQTNPASKDLDRLVFFVAAKCI